MANSSFGPLAQAGPYELAEMAAERMLVGMLGWFADESGSPMQRPLEGAEILPGHKAAPLIFGGWSQAGTADEDTAAGKGSRIIVAASSHRWDEDGGPEYVTVEFRTETAGLMGGEAAQLALHEERAAAIRGILSVAGRQGTGAIAKANEESTQWTIDGWVRVGDAQVSFEDRHWVVSEQVEVTMRCTGGAI